MIKKSMFFRLLISYVLTVLIGLCVVGFTMSYVTKEYITDSKKSDMVRMARKVNLAIQEYPIIDDYAKGMLLFLDQSFDSRIWVFDMSGKIIASSSTNEISIGKSVG